MFLVNMFVSVFLLSYLVPTYWYLDNLLELITSCLDSKPTAKDPVYYGEHYIQCIVAWILN